MPIYKNKKIIIIIVTVVLIAVLAVYFGFIKNKKQGFTLEKVVKGNISQEVSETGTVKVGDEINLAFKTSGKIQKIEVKVGDRVEPGQKLARIDSAQLYIQLNEARANLQMSQAKYNKLIAGVSAEEVKVSQTKVSNAEIAYQNALQSLNDVKIKATSDINGDYEDALPALDSAYLKLENAYSAADDARRTYFTSSDQESLIVEENTERIEVALNSAKAQLQVAKTGTQQNIDSALEEMRKSLNVTSNALEIIKNICDGTSYRDKVSSTTKTSLDTQKTNINTSLTSIVNTQQTISSAKLTNTININSAEAKLSVAKGDLEKAKDDLSLLTAAPRQEDIDVYRAEVRQAQAQVQILESQISDSIIVSPVKGQIARINKRMGETTQPTDSVISLIPENPFQIEIDVYEEDIVKVKVGNPVEITFAAFPEQVFKGRVISIDPAEKLIGGVVYYQVNIEIQEQKQGIKQGMTADVKIKTAFRENVLIVSDGAIEKKNGNFYVQVSRNGRVEERKIEAGLKGEDNKTEVISGLREGEEVVIK